MDTAEVCQDAIPIPGHVVDTRTCDSSDVMSGQKVEKKKKRKASEAGGRNFTGIVIVQICAVIEL